MVDAEIRGKLGADASRAHDRAEDLLTSTVFGLLRYLPFEVGVLRVLSSAMPVAMLNGALHVEHDDDAAARWLGLTSVSSCQLSFWPSFGPHGEPDLLVTLFDRAGRPTHLLVIEAKLYSPKSGEAGDDDAGLAQDVPDPDQLVKYWQGLRGSRLADADVPRTLLYLTSHPAAPSEELAATLARAPSMRLGWLSWRDVWRVAANVARGPDRPLAATDLARLLAHRGFSYFDGLHGDPQPFPSDDHFWHPGTWFGDQMLPDVFPTASFWRTG
jgi:hypothetical protein